MTIASKSIKFFWLLGLILLAATALGAGWVMNQASGGVSSRVARAHGRRHSAAETRSAAPSRSVFSLACAVTAISGRP